MTDMTEEGLRKATILERAKEQCSKLFSREIKYMRFEKEILVLDKLYKFPMASWADKHFKKKG